MYAHPVTLILTALTQNYLFFWDKLKTIVVYEDVDGAALHFVCGDSFTDGDHGRVNDTP